MLVYKLPEDVTLVGKTVDGRYLVERLLAEGGMGRVYVARQLSVDRQVALKVLKRAIASDVSTVQRFQNEARAASRLTSAHTVTVYDFGQEPSGLLYLAMEYVEGRSLYGLIAQEGRLSPERAVSLAAQVLDSLAEAHAKGIVHRDIKPDNVLLTETASGEDWAKVSDFGIAKIVSSEGASLTSTGMVVGTPRYASPEQVRGEPLDARSDIYSTGVLLYELLAGVPPFQDTTPMQVMIRHIQDEPPHLIGMCPTLPSALAQVVHAALAKRREDRPQTATDFRTALLDAVGAARAPRAPTRSPGKPAVVAVGRAGISGHEPTGIAEAPAQTTTESDATGFMDISGASGSMAADSGAIAVGTPAGSSLGHGQSAARRRPNQGGGSLGTALSAAQTIEGTGAGSHVAAGTAPTAFERDAAAQTGLEPAPRRRRLGAITALFAGIGVAAAVIAFLLTRGPSGAPSHDAPPPAGAGQSAGRAGLVVEAEAQPRAEASALEPDAAQVAEPVAGEDPAAQDQAGQGQDQPGSPQAAPGEAEQPGSAQAGQDQDQAQAGQDQAGQAGQDQAGQELGQGGSDQLVASTAAGAAADKPPQASAALTVRVVSTPSGAQVLDGEVVLGTTPLDVEITEGAPRTLVLESDGFSTYELELDEGSSPEVAVALRKERARRKKSGSSAQSAPAARKTEPKTKPEPGGLEPLSVPYID